MAAVPNVADAEQVKTAERKEKRVRERDLFDVCHVMGTPHGRRFVNRLLEFSGLFKSSFTGNNTTFFNEGQRNVGLMLIADLNEACPELYLKMISEAKEAAAKES